MTTKHTHPVIFGRREPGCPRCAELDAGAPAIAWRGARAAQAEHARTASIRAHDCRRAGCGPVCAAFDW